MFPKNATLNSVVLKSYCDYTVFMRIRESDKSRMRMTGVYAIVNCVNGKRYIGSAAISFIYRRDAHFRKLTDNRHHSIQLQRAWNKYGSEAFEFRIMETTDPKHAVAVEQTFIDAWGTAKSVNGYNRSPTAGSNRGIVLGPETRARMSAAKTGNVPSDATRARLVLAQTGKTVTAETRAKLSAINKGKKLSDETKAKMSAVRKGKKLNVDRRGRKGKKWTEETRKKIQESKMVRPKLKKDVAKSKYVRVRVTISERAQIMRRWKSAGAKNESDWIRQRLLGDD